jgi:hypothetical protein
MFMSLIFVFFFFSFVSFQSLEESLEHRLGSAAAATTGTKVGVFFFYFVVVFFFDEIVFFKDFFEFVVARICFEHDESDEKRRLGRWETLNGPKKFCFLI